MSKTRFGLLLCLAFFASSVLIAPPFKPRAEATELQPSNSIPSNLFVTYQNKKGAATRQLAAEESAVYSATLQQAERRESLHLISSPRISARDAKAQYQ